MYTNLIVKEKQGSIVTLEQAKAQLNVEEEFHDDDDHILFLIESSTSAAEDYTGIDISLTYNTLEVFGYTGGYLRIQEAPFQAFESITLIDSVGNETVVPETDYTIGVKRTEFIIEFTEPLDKHEKMVIRFFTGYELDSAPYKIQQAILVKINDLYDVERTSYTVGGNFRDNKTFERLLNGSIINRW